ncbi:MAG TPA: ACT domain-containing protein [Clostridiales bacterium]|nr:ACT domain-containing protein [Clostridiales bacterium]
MFLKQISVFVENKVGRLAKVTKILGENGIDISALSIADTANFGILRMIVNDPDKALRVIKDAGLAAKTTEVLAVEVPDRPGGLVPVLEIFQKHNISIEYLYSFVKRTLDSAYILFKVDDIQRAAEALQRENINVLTEQEVNGL